MDWLERTRSVGWDVQPDGCWEWRGEHGKNGRARIAKRIDGHLYKKYAYRITYEALHGPIPDGLEACHTCHTPSCVNPDHIVPGTHLENIRMTTVFHQTRATPEIVAAIRDDYANTKLTQRELANKYDLSKRSITRLVIGIKRCPQRRPHKFR